MLITISPFRWSLAERVKNHREQFRSVLLDTPSFALPMGTNKSRAAVRGFLGFPGKLIPSHHPKSADAFIEMDFFASCNSVVPAEYLRTYIYIKY